MNQQNDDHTLHTHTDVHQYAVWCEPKNIIKSFTKGDKKKLFDLPWVAVLF